MAGRRKSKKIRFPMIANISVAAGLPEGEATVIPRPFVLDFYSEPIRECIHHDSCVCIDRFCRNGHSLIAFRVRNTASTVPDHPAHAGS